MLDRTSKLKISKNIEDLINTIHKLNLLNIYRILCPTVAKYTFLSNSHRTFTKVDYVLGHKTSLKKRKKKILGGVMPCVIRNNSSTRDWTHAHHSGSMESSLLDCKGSFQVSRNFKGFKSYKACSQTTIELN